MISYNWEYKPDALRLKKILFENGYKVWIDVEDMGEWWLCIRDQQCED